MQEHVSFALGSVVPQKHIAIVMHTDTPSNDLIPIKCYEYMAILSASYGPYLTFRRYEAPDFQAVEAVEYGIELMDFCLVFCFSSYYSEIVGMPDTF